MESLGPHADLVDPDHIRRFRRLCRGLNKLMDEVRLKHPNAGYFMGNSEFTMLTHARPREMYGATPQETIVSCITIDHADAGGW